MSVNEKCYVAGHTDHRPLCINRDFTYYKMNNLDNRITNPDQLLTTDVERFCSSITELYSNISKPMLDIVIYVQKLAFTIGGQVIFIYYRKLDSTGIGTAH